eukprot:TRINITY_DN1472_c0_g2_i1.p1 TRINITY_DN1472_c0_g2~~TRINITY_DN1472_c0_g2_i1.p1  ORF type:complete len:350 (-),score=36.73 TRINITY_DN1472_c0_g2_i1:30-1079(-)
MDRLDATPVSPYVQLLGYPWSIAVGASVAAAGIFATRINAHAPEEGKELHSIYVSSSALLLGGMLMAPAALLYKTPWGKPTKWYSLMGGVFISFEFLTIPAFNYLGVQVVLLGMLLGMLFTGMLFDCRDGKLKSTEYRRFSGFVVVMAGVIVDYFGPGWFGTAEGSTPPFTSASLPWLMASFACGVCYTFMAKSNSQLAKDLGSSSRATLVCGIVAVLSRAPLMAWIYFGRGIAPTLSFAGDWQYFLAAATQSAFYNASLAILPSLLGYTTNYVVMLVGKLVFSSIIDAFGFTDKTVPMDLSRVLGVLLVLAGTIVSSVTSGKQQHSPGQLLNTIGSYGTSQSELAKMC